MKVKVPGDLGNRRGPRAQQCLRRDAFPAQYRAWRRARSAADASASAAQPRSRCARPASAGPSRRRSRSCRTRAGDGLTKATAPIRRLCAPMAKRWCEASRASSVRPTSVLATAKHYLGDGGTFHGKDQGETRTTEANLARTHAAGYYGALKANVQTVMVSYSSFTDTATGKRWGKMHGNAPSRQRRAEAAARLQRTGRQRLERRSGRCPAAPTGTARRRSMPGSTSSWFRTTGRSSSLRRSTMCAPGRIPMSRIDDAVSRIIRVKLKAGLFDALARDRPASRCVGAALAGSSRARAQAVRESLVLLKNDRGVLPLRPHRQDPRRRRGRGQPADAGRRVVADLAGRPDDRRRIIPMPTPCSRRCARRSAPDRSITAPTARASTFANIAPS